MFLETRKEFEMKYDDLKKSIIEIARCTPQSERKEKIESLKICFGKHIRSVRQLEAAEELDYLIYLLEKRLVLGWFNVELFSNILEEFEIDGLTFDEFRDYRDKLADYKMKNKKAFMFPPYDPNVFCEVPSNREVIPAKIHEYICNEMGDDWRHFGRELIAEGLTTEGCLDELERCGRMSNKEKTQKLLDDFVLGDKRTKMSQLSKVLKSIQRSDIDDELERMFFEYCGF